MPYVEIAYIDESYDDAVFAMSALLVPVGQWRDGFEHLKAYRSYLKSKYGIFTSHELHATHFIAGKGRISPKPVPKGLRAHLFQECLTVITQIPGARIISGAWQRNGRKQGDIHAMAFSRIMERLQRRCKQVGLPVERMLLVIDEGREDELRQVSRKTKLFNAVGSQQGGWEDGSAFKNIPNDRLIEDPIFKPSHQSLFLQAADFVAFALLKSEVPPTPKIGKYKLNDTYRLLEPILAKEASPKEKKGLGIVRT